MQQYRVEAGVAPQGDSAGMQQWSGLSLGSAYATRSVPGCVCRGTLKACMLFDIALEVRPWSAGLVGGDTSWCPLCCLCTPASNHHNLTSPDLCPQLQRPAKLLHSPRDVIGLQHGNWLSFRTSSVSVKLVPDAVSVRYYRGQASKQGAMLCIKFLLTMLQLA